MTTPFPGPLNIEPFDISVFCCTDPAAGGCGHDASNHTGPNGGCAGVFGCGCLGFKTHKPGCIHQPAPTG